MSMIERWLRRWQTPTLFDGGGRCPYLVRWRLWHKTRFGSCYIHKFVGDDWSLDLHDHTSRFISIGLRGSYEEYTPHGVRTWRAPWIRTFPATHTHRLVLRTPTVWTLVLTGPKRRRSGFHVEGAWVVADTYLTSPRADDRRSC